MKNKKIILIVVAIILILGVSVFFFIKSKEVKITFKKANNIEINSKIYNTDLIKSIKNGKLQTKKEIVNTSKLGSHKIKYIIKNYFKKNKEYFYTITVVDTEKPTIKFDKQIETTIGVEADLLKNVKAEDNSKEEIKVTVDGEYDFKKTGTYKLYYIAKDSSKNEAKEEFTLVVKEKPKDTTIITNPDKTFTTTKGFKGYTKNGLTYIAGYLVANKTYSLPSTYNPGLNSEVQSKANVMFNDAKKEGLNIYISSGFRSYNTQKNLYNNYVARDGQNAADTYSARPGHSEHQTGLAFDVNQINSSFDNTAEAKWLASNCYKYGFILRYPKGKENETGYIYESWHFRYVGTDLANKLYNNGNWITMETYFGITSKYN